jgi:hypothetical protein
MDLYIIKNNKPLNLSFFGQLFTTCHKYIFGTSYYGYDISYYRTLVPENEIEKYSPLLFIKTFLESELENKLKKDRIIKKLTMNL